jgi:hypothetical protein
MKRTIAVLTIALALALPASSSAFWLQNLSGSATLSSVRFEVEVCGARGKLVHLEFLYSNLEGEGLIWPVYGRGHQPYYCANWWVEDRTPMWDGHWGLGVAVTVAGHTRTLPSTDFWLEE